MHPSKKERQKQEHLLNYKSKFCEMNKSCHCNFVLFYYYFFKESLRSSMAPFHEFLAMEFFTFLRCYIRFPIGVPAFLKHMLRLLMFHTSKMRHINKKCDIFYY